MAGTKTNTQSSTKHTEHLDATGIQNKLFFVVFGCFYFYRKHVMDPVSNGEFLRHSSSVRLIKTVYLEFHIVCLSLCKLSLKQILSYNVNFATFIA